MPKSRGFTMIEVMIVIAVIAIIAAVAIPNLLRSRTHANEATAVTCVRNYGTAQITFQLGGAASVLTNTNPMNSGLKGFADNYCNLFYGNPRTVTAGSGLYIADATRTLGLIEQSHADAYAIAPKGMPTNAVPITQGGAVVHQGYYFTEDPDMFNAAVGGPVPFANNYATIALPANSSTTGQNLYWMDSENTVLRKGAPAGQEHGAIYATLSGKTPLTMAAREGWSAL